VFEQRSYSPTYVSTYNIQQYIGVSIRVDGLVSVAKPKPAPAVRQEHAGSTDSDSGWFASSTLGGSGPLSGRLGPARRRRGPRPPVGRRAIVATGGRYLVHDRHGLTNGRPVRPSTSEGRRGERDAELKYSSPCSFYDIIEILHDRTVFPTTDTGARFHRPDSDGLTPVWRGGGRGDGTSTLPLGSRDGSDGPASCLITKYTGSVQYPCPSTRSRIWTTRSP
jgi:hypothetical protein